MFEEWTEEERELVLQLHMEIQGLWNGVGHGARFDSFPETVIQALSDLRDDLQREWNTPEVPGA